jgi:SAM-dependent methyltransferase
MPVEQWAIDRKRDRAVADYPVDRMRGIEIGPLCYPLLKREKVPNLFYLDHASRDELRNKYAHDPNVECDLIPDIDYVVSDGDLAEAVSDKSPFDFVLASHVVEHVPDLVGWLQNIESILSDNGRLILVVPDKRFSFDIFRALTTIDDIWPAFLEKRKRPDLRTLMDCLINVVNASPWHLWEDYSSASGLSKMYDNAVIEKVANTQYPTGEYVDTHCWVFTPWTFLGLMGELVRRNAVHFDCTYFLTTQPHDCEFYLHLTKRSQSNTNWVQMAQQAYSEAIWPKKLNQGAAAVSDRCGLSPNQVYLSSAGHTPAQMSGSKVRHRIPLIGRIIGRKRLSREMKREGKEVTPRGRDKVI